MIKTHNEAKIKYYRREVNFRNEVASNLNERDRKRFYCPLKMYKEKGSLIVVKENY